MCLYPCYIDGTKTVAEGRRIPKNLACVKQPWAKDIVEALKELRLSQAFEVIAWTAPHREYKTHETTLQRETYDTLGATEVDMKESPCFYFKKHT